MKKTIFILALFLFTAQVAHAEIRNVRVLEGSTLTIGQAHTLMWSGEPEEGVDRFSVWLVGGTLNNSNPKFLGSVDSNKQFFTFTVPTDVRPGKSFVIQLSGKYASGSQVQDLQLVTKMSSKLARKNVILTSPNNGVLYEGEKNIISWSGGRDVVMVGVMGETDLLGWISADAKPNSSLTWTGKEICDGIMSVCDNFRDELIAYSPSQTFRIIVVSEDSDGNLLIGGNSDMSDFPIGLSSTKNVPGTELSKAAQVKLLEEQIKSIQLQLRLLKGTR